MKPKFSNIPKPRTVGNSLASQAQVQLKEAIALHQKGQLAQAEAIYEDILKTQPKHVQLLHLLGVIAFQTQNYQRAVDLIGKAIEINPNNADFYSNRGIALKELKRLDEAVASYDRAIRIKPDFAEAHNNRGNALTELRQLAAAVESYDRAISIKPDHAKAHYYKSSALLMGGEFANGWEL